MESFEEAAAALAAANNEDNPAPAPAAPAASEQAPATQEAGSTVEAGPTETSESFTHIDINSLPEELQVLAKQLQGDYTRKTQEVATWRKLGEQYGDPSSLEEAAQFVSRLQSDPSLQQELYQALQSRFEASAPSGFQQEYEEEEVDPRDRALQTLEERVQRFEAQQMAHTINAQLDAQINTIRESNPDYKQEDFDYIEMLGISHNGDLMAAADTYSKMRSGWIGNYLNSKGSVKPGAALPLGSSAETPVKIENMKQADEAARVALMAALESN